MGIRDKVVIITGASAGIGQATAVAFSNSGAKVVLVARRHEILEQLAGRLADALVIQADLAEEGDCRMMIDLAISRFGRIDILINNAASIIVSASESVSREDLLKAFTTNLLGPVTATQAIVPHSKKQERYSNFQSTEISSMRTVISLKQRPTDYIYIGFFLINILFITYIVDLEQLVIADPSNFNYPIWPLPFFVDMIHWWGANFDPLQWLRPTWWKATIWLDVILFGPYYVAAVYAFVKGREWIRIPTFIVMSILFTNVFIICAEEIFGPTPAKNLPLVLFANAPWFLFPVFLVWKMWKKEHPFTKD